MTDDPKELEYRPTFVQHVVGRYPQRTWDDVEKRWDPQPIVMLCEKCRSTWRYPCESGRPREHIARFALGHVGCGNPGSPRAA